MAGGNGGRPFVWLVRSPDDRRPAGTIDDVAETLGGERAISTLMAESHVTRGDELPALAQRHVAALGGAQVHFYLADLQQTALVPFVGSRGPDAPDLANQLSIDTTLAGRAFQSLQIETQENRSTDAVA